MIGSILGQALVNQTGIPTLFYLSWVFTTVGLFCFFLLPIQKNDPPISLVRIILQYGYRTALHDLKMLYSDILVMYWSIWWILAYGAYSIIANYYQTVLYNLDNNGNFGLIEAFMEAT